MNNASNVAFAILILDGKATIEDVPAQLQAGVSEVVAYFTKTAQPSSTLTFVDEDGQAVKVVGTPTTAPATAADANDADHTQSDADQAIDDANKAVDDATK